MIQPLGDRVVVKAFPATSETESGLILTNALPQQRGEVIAAAPGLAVKQGDTVMYGIHAGSKIELEKEEYLVLRESEIFAII